MRSNYELPLNIGSDKQISINDLTRLVVEISKKYLKIKNVEGPVGVRGRNSHNKLIQKVLDWTPNCDLVPGLSELYFWVKKQINENSLTKLNYNNP